MRKKWISLLVLAAAISAAAATVSMWGEPFLDFLDVQSDRIQALADLIQIVLWIAAGLGWILGLRTIIREVRARPEEPTRFEIREIEFETDIRKFIGRDNYGNLTVIVNPTFLWREIDRTQPAEDLQLSTEKYLQYVVDRYRYLDFKGMGVTDRIPLRISLLDLYVPLKARKELTVGETWDREARLAGRKVMQQDEEELRLSEPRPVLDLVKRYDGLIVLGDPGAGKTTLLKYLVLRMATGEYEELGLDIHLPVLVPLSEYANSLAEGDIRLDDFICQYFHSLGMDLPLDQMLKEALRAGGALVLLDGLDEVKDISLRETVIRRVAEFFAFHRQAGNKFVLTSRIVGYKEVRPAVEELEECTLVDFEDEEIEEFVERWTSALEKAARGGDTPFAIEEAQRERQELMEAITRNAGVRRLACNPLMLTILALMKRQGVTLPERRVELYQLYVETLLTSWNRARGLGRPPSRELKLGETLKVLAPLAYWMHETSPGLGLVHQEKLRNKLEEIYQGRGLENTEEAVSQFLSDVHEYTALLIERGMNQFGFIHLTFEEYLAGMAMAQLGQQEVKPVVDDLLTHLGDSTWHESSLLAIGYLGVVQRRDEAAGAVVNGLLDSEKDPRGEAAVLAGEAVADILPDGVTGDALKRTVTTMINVIGDPDVEAKTRSRGGDVLARIGDPRFRSDAWYLPDEDLLGFVEIPGGSFLMGSDPDVDEDAGKNERPQHEVPMTNYYIARYPVTVAQFQAFVEDSDYQQRYQASLRGLVNYPVTDVTWHDAIAYCGWLTERLRDRQDAPEPIARLLREDGWKVTLPSEAEWEKAARGTHGWIYPWGNEPNPNNANYEESGIGKTSAVGCFPGGKSPYDVQDMSGNVWEWTRSIYKPYPYDPEDGQENLDVTKDVVCVLRGGSFNDYHRLVRCAIRLGNHPHFRFRFGGFRVVVSPSDSGL